MGVINVTTIFVGTGWGWGHNQGGKGQSSGLCIRRKVTINDSPRAACRTTAFKKKTHYIIGT